MAALFRCKGCTERHPACHSTCEKYKEDKAKYDELKAAKSVDRSLDDYVIKQVVGYSDKNAKIHKSHRGIIKPTGR